MSGSDTTRRTMLGMAMGVAATAVLPARVVAQTVPGDELMPLWPGRPPGDQRRVIARRIDDQSHDKAKPDRWTRGIDQPFLVVRRPVRPNGAAALICPGGGYGFLSYDNEGLSQARWLNAIGVTAFVLIYRLPDEGWADRALVPLQDAQRAMRLMRQNAGRLGVDPTRVAVLGFSAGGHLAGSLATRHAEPTYAPVDVADRISARPDLAGLLYPVVTMVARETHGGSRDSLLGVDASLAARRAASVELRVDAATPPVFLTHAADDGTVPVANSLMLYQALLDAHRPAELHVFEEGGHGFGVRLPPAMPAAAWPRLFAAFAARKGVFPPQAA